MPGEGKCVAIADNAGEVAELKAALVALQLEERQKADAFAAANQTLSALRLQMEQVKADAAASTDSGNTGSKLDAVQAQLDLAISALKSKKSEAEKASAKTAEAEAALVAAVAAVPNSILPNPDPPADPANSSGSINLGAIIGASAAGLVVLVASAAAFAYRAGLKRGATPTYAAMNNRGVEGVARSAPSASAEGAHVTANAAFVNLPTYEDEEDGSTGLGAIVSCA